MSAREWVCAVSTWLFVSRVTQGGLADRPAAPEMVE